MSERSADLQPNASIPEISAKPSKTQKNRKYRHHQRNKRNISKLERIEKINELTKERDSLLKANEEMRVAIEKKDMEYSNVVDLWNAAESRVLKLEKMLKEKDEGEFLVNPDPDF
jgi:DNA polymerase II small subunit/DNA polymerase delta subunit B